MKAEQIQNLIDELAQKTTALSSANEQLAHKENELRALQQQLLAGRALHQTNLENSQYEAYLSTPDGTLQAVDMAAAEPGYPKNLTPTSAIKRALLDSEEKYKYLFYSNPIPYWIYDLTTTRFLEVNDKAVAHYGYSREEFLAMTMFDIRPPEDHEKFKKLRRNVEDGKLMHKSEWRHIKKNGELFYVDVTSYKINYEGRDAALVMANDITERKKTDDTLKNSELRFRSLIEKGNEIIALHDLQGRIEYMSPSIQAILGYPAEDRVGKSAFEYTHPDDIAVLKAKLNKLLENPGSSATAQWRQQHANGSWRWMEGVATNLLKDPAVNAVVHNFRDITRQKEAEDRLIREKELSESVINSLPGIFYLCDESGKFLRWNLNFETVSGYTSSELSQMHPLDFFDEDEKALLAKRIDTVYKTGMADVEAHFLTKYGEKIPYYFTGRAIEFEGRECLIGTGIDIAERKKAEDAIKDSEEKRRLIMNAALDAIICMNTAGAITFWNPQAEKIFGWKEAEIMGTTLSTVIIPEPYRAMHNKGLQRYLETGENSALNILLELSAIDREGKTFPIELTILPIKQAGEEFFCAFIRDISKRKAIEDTIRTSKERYDIVTKATNDSIWDWDLLTNKTVRDNKKLETLFGYEGWEGTDVDYNWNRLAHPEDWSRVTKRRNAILEDPNEYYWEDEYRFLRTNGEYAYVYDRGYILRDENGRPVRIIGASSDISERKLAEEKVKAERNLLRTLIDNMPDAIYVKDTEGRKLLSNKVDLEIMGVESEAHVLGKTDLDLYPDEMGAEAYAVDMQVIKTGEAYVKREQHFITQSGKQYWLLTTKVPLYNEKSEVTGLVGIGTDITARKVGEEHLKLLESVITHTADSILVTEADPLDNPGPRIIYVNDAFSKMSGYSREEVIGLTPRILQGPNTDRNELARLRQALEKGQPCTIEVINYKKNGEEFWINMSIVPIVNEKEVITHFISVERDVTERKNAQNEMKQKNSELKKLSNYLQNVREEERKYIAREVHDELGQLASALKIDIDWLNIKVASLEEKAKNRLAHANKTIEVLISSIRKIASNLRPSILDDFGLNAALNWHCTEFQNLNGVQCIFEPGFDDTGLGTAMKTEMYRMAQESLTNVMRHAKATAVTVSTREDAAHYYLTVTDNGKGFDVTQRKNTLGLIGLRERAISLDGELYIESILGSGTTISAVIPKP